jgi:hypothetical protein
MSFKKPFRAVPLKSRSRRSAASNIISLTRSSAGRRRGLLVPLGVAVAAGAAFGWVWSGNRDAKPVATQSFVAQPVGDTVVALQRMEATEPPETLTDVERTEGQAATSLAPTDNAKPRSVYYRFCEDAWRAGAAPLFRGQPGYRDALDRDGDGVACEPYPGR